MVYSISMMKPNAEHTIADLSLEQELTAEQAELIYEQGKEAVVFVLLKLSQLAAAKTPGALVAGSPADPSCPSGQKPVFVKPNKNDKRNKKPGRKKGHPGSRRKQPTRIDRTEEHRASCCPDCGGKLKKCSGTRERIIEDIPGGV